MLCTNAHPLPTMPTHPTFPGLMPSRRVTARKYSEEWAWWAASGWAMLAQDKLDGGLHLLTSKNIGVSTRLWGTQATAEQVATPALVRHFLAISLYLHLHPRKATKHYAATGEVCSATELAAFVRAQRRKVANTP
jgi:hypothetical protein